MSGFSNPVSNAVGTLIRTVLKSFNYIANTTGWAIFKNGNADFAAGAFRGSVTVTGPNGAQIVIDAGAFYPNLNFYSPDHSNFAGIAITGGTSNADMIITSGQYVPADTIPRSGRLWFDGAGGDVQIFQVMKSSNQASFGGQIRISSTDMFVGYRDSDAAKFYYLTIDKNGTAGFSSGVNLHMLAGSTLSIDSSPASTGLSVQGNMISGSNFNVSVPTMPNGSTTSGTWVDMPGSPGFLFTKWFDNTSIEIEIHGSMFTSVAQAGFDVGASIGVSGDFFVTGLRSPNGALGSHTAFPSGVTKVAGISHGIKLITGRWQRVQGTGTLNTDGGDVFSMTAREVAA
jgi:hypothetical protein